MKQSTGGKNKKWIWLAVGIGVLLVAAAVVLAILLMPGRQGSETTGQSKLYWNVDKAMYTENSETGLTSREPGEDGLYHIRLAVDGQQIEMTAVADRQLINYIDTMNVLGIVTDTEGMIVDAVPAKNIATEVGRDFYVKSVEGGTVILNSSMTMNGMEVKVSTDGKTGIYEVFPEAQTVGQRGALVPMDVVTVYADDQGNVTHIFITERAKDADLYWRIGTYYNTTKACTTREPDENGVYTLLFAYNGKQVELKCRDVEIVNTIDGRYYGACGLVLDDEGYIVEYMHPALAIRGVEIVNNANITELNGNYFSATRFIAGDGQGTTIEGTIDETVGIYLVCEGGTENSYIGEPTTLQPDDRITCYSDVDGNLKLVFVVKRMVDSPMYFNLNRQYISSQKRTERSPDPNGWYVFEMAVQGKVITVRTKDHAIANQIDSISTQAMGLKLKGDIVEKVYAPECICGWSSAAVGRYVTGMSSMILSAAHPAQFDDYVNLILNAECEIYDVSGAYGKVGAKTEPRVGDEVTAFRNVNGELTHVFITNRYVEGSKIYYNTQRRYNSATKLTTRTPDAEGYYVYEMVCEGKLVTVKTKSKDMASYIDKQNAPLVALKVSNGIVREAYPAISAVRYGSKAANYHYIASGTENKFRTYYYSGTTRVENPTEYTLASNCVVYNVSEGYVNYRGEKTTLKVDDRIQAIATNPKGYITHIFVMERKVESSLYWNTKPMYNAAKAETTRTPDAEGYYVYQLAVKGTVRTLKTKDKALASKLDSYTTAVGLLLNGDIIKQVYPTSTVKGIKTLSIGRYDVMGINGKTITFTRNRPTSSNYGDTQQVKLASGCKIYDVSEYAEKFGAAVQLQLGDRVAGYINDAGELVYAYIVNRNTHKAGHISYCAHCDKDVFWEPYASEIVEADVHYYLPCDSTVASRLTIGKPDDENNYDVVFDLNGFTLSCTRQAFLVCDRLSVMDTAAGGTILVTNTDGGIGGGIMVSGGKLNLYSGTLTAAENAGVGSSGGLVYLASNAVCNMYGGTVTGGKVAGGESVGMGGNVIVTATAAFNMYGGIVSGGEAGNNGRGGNIYASGKLTLSGGQVLGGTAERGGNIYLAGSAAFCVTDSKILDGVAANRGGNICDEGSTSVISGGVISGGVAQTTFGGNICITDAANMTVSGGTIEKGTAVGNGGNLAVTSVNATISMTGGQITGGKAEGSLGGGNIYLAGTDAENTARFIMTGGTVADGIANFGGNLRLNANSEAHIGGTVTGGAATEGASISLGSATAKLVISGTVTGGDVYVNKNKTTILTGAPVVESLVIVQGNRVVLDEMTKGADITVSAKDAFTVANDAAESYASYFTAADAQDTVFAKDGVLYCGMPSEPSVPTEPSEPSEPTEPTEPSEPEDGEINPDAQGYADCPVCERSVQWTALSGNGRIGYQENKTDLHYYLSSDVDTGSAYSQFAELLRSGACLHLNGKSLTCGGRIHVGAESTLNIMGTGTVTCDGAYIGNNATTYVVATLQVQGINATVNLYGGTYRCTVADLPVAQIKSAATATLNVYDGAVIEGTQENPGVQLVMGNLNMNGGIIQGGVQATKGTVSLNGSAAVSDGITVSSDSKLQVYRDWTGAAGVSFGGSTYGYGDMIDLAHGQCQGGSYTGSLILLELPLQPRIFGLDGQLLVAEEAAPQTPSEGARGAMVATQANAMSFPEDGSDYVADCPACGEKQVTWKSITTNSRVGYNVTGHFYCTGITANPHTQFIGLDNGGTVCLHLNGQALSNAGRIAVLGGGSVINIMGTGSVTGKGTTTEDYLQGVLVVQNAGTINLYGGTYTSALADMPVVFDQHASSVVNLYSGAVIDSNVGHNVDVINGTFNMYGGEIKNAVTTGSGGNIRLRAVNGIFNMYGGAISGGQSSATNAGGNVYITGGSRFNLYDGTVTGGVGTGIYSHGIDIYVYNGVLAMNGGTVDGQVAVRTGYTVNLNGRPVIKGSGLWLEESAKVTWGELKQGTEVVVCTEGAFTDPNENAAAYAGYFKTPSQLSKILVRDNVLYCESDCTADSSAPLTDGKSFKVLVLTSSFGLNTTEFLYDIAKAQGATDVVIGRLYASGCSLQKHVTWANDGTAGYEYTKNSTGTWEKTLNATLLDGLLDEDWDIIYLQQSGANSPAISTYGDYIDQLITFVNANKTNPDAPFIWNMTWAYQSDSDQPVFVEDFKCDQMAMYQSILNAVRKKVQVREDIAAIIPSGTAIQNARTSYFGDTLTVDTYHLNNLGRVIAGYTAYAILTDSELTQINLNEISSYDIPETLVLSDSDKAVILEAVNAAVRRPFEVTPSSYTSDPDLQ